MKNPLATPAILITLDDLVEALDAGTDDPSDREQIAADDDLFVERASVFFDAYMDEVQARGLDRPPHNWPPLPSLVALEQEFVRRGRKDGDLDDTQAADYFAAVKTTRDWIVWKQREQAKLN